MIKDIESTLKYVKLDKEFLSKVFMAGSDKKIYACEVSQSYGQVYLARVKRDDISLVKCDPIFNIENDFEITDVVNNNIDTQFTEIFQKGMVKTLAKTNKFLASRYITDLKFYQENQLSKRIKELVDLVGEQE